jgi:hypothetical protein
MRNNLITPTFFAAMALLGVFLLPIVVDAKLIPCPCTTTEPCSESGWPLDNVYCSLPPQVLSFTASSYSVAYNGTTNISWTSKYSDSCSITANGLAWRSGLSGTNVTSNPLTQNTDFVIICTDTKIEDTRTLRVNVAPPDPPDFTFVASSGSASNPVQYNDSFLLNSFFPVSIPNIRTYFNTPVNAN